MCLPFWLGPYERELEEDKSLTIGYIGLITRLLLLFLWCFSLDFCIFIDIFVFYPAFISVFHPDQELPVPSRACWGSPQLCPAAGPGQAIVSPHCSHHVTRPPAPGISQEFSQIPPDKICDLINRGGTSQ